MEIIKTVNRNIAKSKNCRCKYGDASMFDILQVNINYNENVERWQIESKYLSMNKDSIHFYPSISDGKLFIKWNNEVSPYIHKIQL